MLGLLAALPLVVVIITRETIVCTFTPLKEPRKIRQPSLLALSLSISHACR